MKDGKVKVGCKFGSEHFQTEVNVRLPENVEDMLSLSKGSGDFVVQMFTRGWRIWNQEQSGARDFVAASTVSERESADFAAKVQQIVSTADPLAPAKRTGRPAKPQEVTVTPEEIKALKGDMNKFAALLASKGVKVSVAANG